MKAVLSRCCSALLIGLLAGLLGLAACEIPTETKTTSNTSSNGSGSTTSSTGTLQISADSYARVYVNGGYVSRGSCFLTLAPGSYLVTAYSPTTGNKCWETRTTVYAGKNSVVSNNAYCR